MADNDAPEFEPNNSSDEDRNENEPGEKDKPVPHIKPGFSKVALAVVYVTIFLDVFAWGFLNPVLPYIVDSFVQDKSSVGILNGLVNSSYSFAQMIGSFVLGSLSDSWGRRPILLICLLMSGVSLAATGFTNSVWSLTLVRSMAGLFAGSLPIGVTYVGDVVTKAGRPKYMGLVGLAVSLGLVLGPAVGGAMSQKSLYFYVCSLYEDCCEPGTADCIISNATVAIEGGLLQNATRPACTCMKYGASSLLAAGFNIVNFLVAIFFIKESRPKISKEEKEAAKKAADYVKMSSPRKYGFAVGYAAVFLSNFGFCVWDAQAPLVYASAWFPDAQATGWQSAATWNGVGFAVFGVIMGVAQAVLAAPLIKKFGVRNVLAWGCFLRCLAFIATLWVPSGGAGVMISVVMIALTGALNFSGFQVMAAGMSPPQIMGRMMGLMQTIIALARATAPIVGGIVYDLDNRTSFLVDHLSINSTAQHEDDGYAIYLLSAGCMLLATFCLAFMPVLPIKDTHSARPWCCKQPEQRTRELRDPLMSDADSENARTINREATAMGSSSHVRLQSPLLVNDSLQDSMVGGLDELAGSEDSEYESISSTEDGLQPVLSNQQ